MTDQYAVFGNPIAQSKSPLIHTMFAQQTRQDLAYSKQEVPVNGFDSAADHFFKNGGRGLNITAPFKLDAFTYASSLSQGAELAGAVNTLIKHEDGGVSGENTDGLGLVNDISKRLGWQIENKRVLILGAGGAVRGVLYPLLIKNPAALFIANRTLNKAQALAEKFEAFGNISVHDFTESNEEPFDIIINGTSASLSDSLPPLNTDCVGIQTCVYDMVYSNTDTAFMRWAKLHGANSAADGKGMLVAQAAESFRLWRGITPKVEPVLAALDAAT